MIEVQFGNKADDVRKYLNKGAEMWGRVKGGVSIGSVEKDELLVTDLTGVEYRGMTADQIQQESKKST
ncbi:hypothetical protein [Rhodoferax sp.]|uniref:hypothetical protein n=1 Tax=Rhodoferax sp. TaxID=50421 RepID=UPI002ACD5BCD|nr:hypothetical protein [Rhodoferax sp.]